MDGERFDSLIKGFGAKRVTRLSAIRGLVASTAAAVTGVSLLAVSTEAKKNNNGPKSNPKSKKKTICHCTNSNAATCFTKRMRPKSAKKHLKHGCDYAGACIPGRSGCPAVATGGSGPQPAVGCSSATCDPLAPTCGTCIGNQCVEGIACDGVCLGPDQYCCGDVICDVPCVGDTCPSDVCSADECYDDYDCNSAVAGCQCRDKDEYGYGTCSTKDKY